MRFRRAAICVLFLAVALDAQPRAPRSEPYAAALARLDAMTTLPLTQWRSHADLPHGEDPSLDDSAWTPVTLAGGRGGRGGGGSGDAWYRTTWEIPQAAGGHDLRGSRILLQVRFSNDGRVFFNGGLVAQGDGRTLDPLLLTAKAVPGQKIVIAVKVPYHAENGRFQGAQLLVDYPGQPDPGTLRSHIVAAQNVLSGFPDALAEHRKQLDEAVQAIDLAALDRGDQQAFARSLEASAAALRPVNDWMKQFTIRLVGNAHIDMAWLWPWTETVEVVRDTFTTALQLMKEYPDFTYAQSSVQDFEWLQEKYPAIFREIQRRVAEGRWELVGGMWVEPDLNMPDGESLVRQLLVGTRWFKRHFNVDVNIGWNPDSFGYTWQLPQIYKKSGFDTFVTQKMSWNSQESSWRQTYTFPHKLFWWQSPDGSRVLTYFPHGYSGGISSASLSQDIADYVPSTGFPQIMHLYGVGDHGGGPTRQMVDEAVRLQEPSAIFPKVQFSTARAFFDDAEKAITDGNLKPPVWNDELYLAYHRGCYTTQAETKKLIRQNEELLQNAEKFAALSFLTAQRRYSSTAFEEIWKRVLFDQFHDIMPGSGIGINYVDAERNLTDASLRSEKLLDGALDSLNGMIDTRGEGVPVVVYNPLSWDRAGPVKIDAVEPPAGQHLEARDSAGQPLLAQVVAKDATTRKVTLNVLVKGVPSLGYEVIHLVAVANSRPAASALKVDGFNVENEFFRMKVDSRTGCVTSLVNKSDGRESVAAGGCGNLLEAFKDVPRTQDAWEIRFDEDVWPLKQPRSVEVMESGPERAVVRIRHTFHAPNRKDGPDSTIQQDLTVWSGVPRIDVNTQVEWHEQHVLLKAGFPVNVRSDKAAFEIPYGSIDRPTTRNTPAEQGMFEVPALRWGDISNADQGFSMLNDSKYGYDAKDNVIRLSLLRSPQMPAPDNHIADQGFHEFTYSLYAHASGWKTGGTMRQGYELNYPLVAAAAQTHAGPWKPKMSFARIEPGNVILTVLKKAEDDDSLVFRFYEFEGKQTEVRLQLPRKAVSAAEVNLMEKRGQPVTLSPSGQEVTIATGPYEIKSVGVTFANQ
ncbi:MAG TPA: glycoside hydrolase family 38 C-terminal domain-containing protein [Bryobacteraceae bacterium]|nr:glycoside hydrolase family 38 C-terminal domain-containing protein [Bryobacteraceae bacterium]